MEYVVTRYHEGYDPDITRLCAAFSDESLKEYGLEVGDSRLEEMIQICKAVSFFLLVEGKVVGLIAGMMVNNLTNGKPGLQEIIWYVDKGYRSKGRVLLGYFERAGKMLGAKHVVMALMCNSKAEKLGRYYESEGYKPFEIQFMKELK